MVKYDLITGLLGALVLSEFCTVFVPGCAGLHAQLPAHRGPLLIRQQQCVLDGSLRPGRPPGLRR